MKSEIQELEKAERIEELREMEVSLQRYADLYDFAPVGYLTLDYSGCVRECNLVAAHLLGLDRRHLMGRPLLGLLARADRVPYLEHLAQLRRGRKVPVTTELTFLNRQGGNSIIQLTSVGSKTGPLAQMEIRMAMMDHTVQRRTEEESRQTNQMLQAVISASPLAVMVVSRLLKVQVWNSAAEQLFGWTSSEVIGKPVPIIPTNQMVAFRKLLTSELNGQCLIGQEVQRMRKDGTLIEVSFSSAPLFDSKGRLHAFVRMYEDIRERKRAEQVVHEAREMLEARVTERTAELAASNDHLRREINERQLAEAERQLAEAERQRAEAARQETELRFQAVLDNSPALIFVKDTKGRYLHCNRQFEQLFRVPLSQALGKTDVELFKPGQAAAFRANDQQVLRDGEPMQFEESALHDDGLHTSIVSKFPLVDVQGHIYGIAGMATDVTERKRLEAEVLHIGEMERQRIGQDLHDGLCQLLAGIRWKCQSLSEDLAGKDAEAGKRIGKITSLLSQAVEQARSVAHGLLPIERTPDGLMAALHQLAGLTQDLFGIRCLCEISRPVPVPDHGVATDLFRIAQEAVNNAIRHGKATKVQLKLTRNERELVLRVANDGKTFPERPRTNGVGLKTMNYRCLRMGAALRIGPRRGVGPLRGAVVRCSLPLSRVASNGQMLKRET